MTDPTPNTTDEDRPTDAGQTQVRRDQVSSDWTPEPTPVEPERIDTPTDTPVAPGTPAEDAETFPREYVEKLRAEAAEARVKAKRADDYARQLFTARVAATGRLADPNDLPFDAALVDDPAGLNAALDELIGAHPHYAARTPRGNVGQGATGTPSSTVDLAAMLRGRA